MSTSIALVTGKVGPYSLVSSKTYKLSNPHPNKTVTESH